MSLNNFEKTFATIDEGVDYLNSYYGQEIKVSDITKKSERFATEPKPPLYPVYSKSDVLIIRIPLMRQPWENFWFTGEIELEEIPF